MNNKYMNRIAGMTAIVTCALIIQGCSSAPKGTVDGSARVEDEVSSLNSSIQQGYANQFDVLAEPEFTQAEKHSIAATNSWKDGDSRDVVLDHVSTGKGYIEKAKNRAELNWNHLQGILNARQAVLKAGVRHTPQEKRLGKIDDELRDYSENFGMMTSDETAKFERKYLELEVNVIQNRELAKAMKYFRDAEKEDAAKLAPVTYRQTESDINTAADFIAMERYNPSMYSLPVKKANESAKDLFDVTNRINASSPKISEDAAVQIVMQEKQIKSLQQSLGAEKGAMNAKDKALAKMRMKEQRQEAISSAKDEFSSDEAEVFQQGDKLLIRLKKVNFAPGSSQIPEESKPLLGKVLRSIKKIDASEIRVEGHTDATGGAVKNMELSKQRAREIADWLQQESDADAVFEAVGRGYNKPIATNKTKAGRAQNRRVDVIITPKSSM